MGCNSMHTDLVTEKFYGVSQIMGYQSYGLRELRLYFIMYLRLSLAHKRDIYPISDRFRNGHMIICNF